MIKQSTKNTWLFICSIFRTKQCSTWVIIFTLFIFIKRLFLTKIDRSWRSTSFFKMPSISSNNHTSFSNSQAILKVKSLGSFSFNKGTWSCLYKFVSTFKDLVFLTLDSAWSKSFLKFKTSFEGFLHVV